MKRYLKFIVPGIVAFIVSMLALSSITVIDTNNVGLVKRGGQFNKEELPEGWHIVPFARVYEISGRENIWVYDNVPARTSDQIPIEDLDVDVYVRMNTSQAQEVAITRANDLTKNKDGDYVIGYDAIYRTVRDAIYSAAGQVKSDEAQAKRDEFRSDLTRRAQAGIDHAFGKDKYVVTNVNIRSMVVSKALENARNAAAQQALKTAEVNNAKETAKAEAERKEAEAKGEANKMRAEAEGKADAIRTVAKAMREAGPDYLKQRELEIQAAWVAKWNGAQPTTMLGSGAQPLVQLPR